MIENEKENEWKKDKNGKKQKKTKAIKNKWILFL